MDNIPIDSTISPEQIKNYQMLLNNVFTQVWTCIYILSIYIN